MNQIEGDTWNWTGHLKDSQTKCMNTPIETYVPTDGVSKPIVLRLLDR